MIAHIFRHFVSPYFRGRQGEALREWEKWLSTSVATTKNALATSLQETSLDDATTSENGNIDARVEMASGHVLAQVLTGSSRLANAGDNVEKSIQSVNE